MMKTCFSESLPQERLQVWIKLLEELQTECRDPTSELLSRFLRSEYGGSLNFKELPLIELLCDDTLSMDFFKRLYAIKKEEEPMKYTFDIGVRYSDTLI